MPMSSSCTLDAACSLTIVPSLRMTLFGGRMRNELATPTKMMTRNAMYVDVDTAPSEPERRLIAIAMSAPMKDPNWKIAQKTPKALPLSFSSGYAIMIAPCADHRRAAVTPRMAPARMKNHDVPRV